MFRTPSLPRAFSLVWSLLAVALASGQGIITTVAGTGTLSTTSTGDGGPATSAALAAPVGVAVDSSGNVYVAERFSNKVRKITASTGVISPFAGGGSPANIGEGGPATQAGLVFTGAAHIGLAADTNGNVYIADPGNNRVRKVNSNGVITTVAGVGGLGNSGFSGDGGPATADQLASPSGVALDSAGNIYIADSGNGRIRKVDTSGVITTVAGKGNGPTLGDGGPASNAQFSNPTEVAVDSSGNIYIADVGNNAIRKVDTIGKITSILHGGFGFCSPNTIAAVAADIGRAPGISVDKSGNLYIANSSANCVQELETNGTVSTLAGGGTNSKAENVPAITAALGTVAAVAVDKDANFFLADNSFSVIRKVTARVTPPSALPVVTSVLNGASFQAGISPNSWVTIAGRNFATKADTWDNSIIAGNLPSTLDGIRVTINGTPTFVQYVSQGQINIVAGADVPTGLVQVVVTTEAGASAPFTVNSVAYMPAFFMWPSSQPVATHADFSLAAKPGTFAGANTIAAKPGEVIILWGTGFGPTSPAAPVGVQVSGATRSTTTLPVVQLQLQSTTVFGAALAPGYAALYQIAFQVPADFPDGDYPITGTIAGTPFLGGQALLSVRKIVTP
jgi:uncharacterized protein (TIGR03437 family)